MNSSIIIGQDTTKIKGVSFVGASEVIDESDIRPIIDVNANWVTIMPYGFIGKEGTIQYNTKWQWWGEKEEGVRETIELCKKAGLKVMLKPQIWMRETYTGDFKLSSENDWLKFETSYQNFVLFFLEMAIAQDVELFCIGTEWREFIKARPEFWNQLIASIKKSYEGKLTYAANWDDYEKVPFWKEMDVIGVNGYFPISISKKPDLKELIMGWQIQRKALASFSKMNERNILFTEIGYRSMFGATSEPWEHNSRSKFSEEIQEIAYRALFEVLWEEDWFNGIFIWKWYHNHEKQGGMANIDFTPQNKKAEETIRSFWAK